MMRWQRSIVLVFLFFLTTVAVGQSSVSDWGVPGTQVNEYWIDPSTDLMWAAKDNGKDVSWSKASKYCRNLHLAGYSDWRLPTIFELGAIYDRNANAPGLAGPHDDDPSMWHVKGNLFLTGYAWSRRQEIDGRGQQNGYAFYFNFGDGVPDKDPVGFLYPFTFRRALCLRGAGK